MKKHFILFVLLAGFYCSRAQMPGMGGSGMGAMNGMNNVPQNTSNDGPKKTEPPHGGEIKESGKYNLEVVFDPFSTEEKLCVWVLKSNLKAAKLEGATAKVKVKYVKEEGKEEDIDMVLSDDKFACNVSDGSQAFTAFIVVTIKGKEYRAVYNHKSMGG
jgi:hypothetical protein